MVSKLLRRHPRSALKCPTSVKKTSASSQYRLDEIHSVDAVESQTTSDDRNAQGCIFLKFTYFPIWSTTSQAHALHSPVSTGCPWKVPCEESNPQVAPRPNAEEMAAAHPSTPHKKSVGGTWATALSSQGFRNYRTLMSRLGYRWIAEVSVLFLSSDTPHICAFRAIQVNSRWALCWALSGQSGRISRKCSACDSTCIFLVQLWNELTKMSMPFIANPFMMFMLCAHFTVLTEWQTHCTAFSIASRAIEAVAAPWNSSFTCQRISK